MSRKLSPKSVGRAVYEAVHGAVDWAVSVAVNGAVDLAVDLALYRASQFDHPHPNIDRLVAEIRQTRGGVQ